MGDGGGVGRPRVCKILQKKIRELHGEGLSYREIEGEIGVSYVTAWRYCRVLD